MARTGRWVSFVAKLNKETQEGRIRWRVAGPQSDLLPSDYQQYSSAYVAELDEGTVRIYKEMMRQSDDYEEKYWNDHIVIDIKTTDENEFIRIPKTPGHWDLFDTVSFKANRVDEFVDKFLKSG